MILELLRKKYPTSGYAIFAEVRNKTGYGGGRDTFADAVMMSLWPSRGLTLTGFEFKASRSDWIKEKDDPGKADPIFAHCNQWFLVATSADIVRNGELPAPWGLMLAVDGKLKTVKEAVHHERSDAIDRRFVCSLLRAAQKEAANPLAELRRELEQKAYIEHQDAVREFADKARRCDLAEESHRRLLDRVSSFEKTSGIKIDEWGADAIGNAVQAIRRNPAVHLAEFKRTGEQWRRSADLVDRAIAELEAIVVKP